MTKRIVFISFVLLAGFSCKQSPKTQNAVSVQIDVPTFNADSAYHYTANQVSFGHRIPNTPAHDSCANYLAGELQRFGAQVTVQETTLRLVDNSPIAIKNIIGAFQPDKKNRILLSAHWDSRPYADNDPNPENWNKPIDGANDGAGACAALLEIARQINLHQPAVGVDIVLFDAEDWGEPHFPAKDKHYGDWCMGSKYWAQHPHVQDYKAKYGILLDMVSAPGALFYKEHFSTENGMHIVQKVWEAARITGFGSYFVNANGGGIVDDHIQVNKYRKIPCIDIIHYEPNTDSGFGAYWHTLDDNMNNVSKETLQAVGQTVLYVLYHED
jgi:hypothetical protein